MSKVEKLSNTIVARFDYHVCSISRRDLVKEVNLLIQAVKDECFAYLTCPDCGEEMREYQHLYCDACGHSEVNEE